MISGLQNIAIGSFGNAPIYGGHFAISNGISHNNLITMDQVMIQMVTRF